MTTVDTARPRKLRIGGRDVASIGTCERVYVWSPVQTEHMERLLAWLAEARAWQMAKTATRAARFGP